MSAFNRVDQPNPAPPIAKVLGSHRQEILERGLAPALAEILGYLLQRRWRLSIFPTHSRAQRSPSDSAEPLAEIGTTGCLAGWPC